jgi:hypothetical protein
MYERNRILKYNIMIYIVATTTKYVPSRQYCTVTQHVPLRELRTFGSLDKEAAEEGDWDEA